MQGRMMSQALTIGTIIDHAARYHAGTEIVSVETDGTIARSDWGQVAANSRRLARALRRLGAERSDRCATIAWNNRRHLEIYFGVACGGMVCHTINPRLFPEQITYIVNHAEDRVLFFDRTFLPIVAGLKEQLPTVSAFVLMGGRDEEAAANLPGLLFYDELLAAETDDFAWPDLDENTPSSLCYTSGTTGHPKGVLYSHRSTVLHTLGANQPDALGLSARDVVLPVVPMFHANAWGTPYVRAAQGCKMVLPGPDLSGEALVRLIDGEKVTMAAGVPTIWMQLLDALEKTGSKAESLKRSVVGGAAIPSSMLKTFRDRYGVDLLHGWGMTETSPLGTINQILKKHEELTPEEMSKLRAGQGRPLYGVQLRVVGEDGQPLPEDGRTQGELHVRGFWVVDTYHGAEKTALTADGWFDTGDVATIDADGFMIIRDRSKDIIKSGGEWISTVELEDIAISHPGVANAAAIAAKHPKWDERPVLIAVRAPGSEVTEEEILAHYEGRVARWQAPDRVIFVDALPIGGTGKVLKHRLREEYGGVFSSDMAGE